MADQKTSKSPNVKKHTLCKLGNVPTNYENYVILKKKLRARKKFLMDFPHIQLTRIGLKAVPDSNKDNTVPLVLRDVQHLMSYIIFGPYLKPYNNPPRWCNVHKYNKICNILLVVVSNVDEKDYLHNGQFFHIFDTEYATRVLFRQSECKTHLLTNLIASSTDYNSQTETSRTGTKNYLTDSISAVKNCQTNSEVSKDKFDRRHLLLSLQQMSLQRYPLRFEGKTDEKFAHYRMTKSIYKPVTEKSPLFAIDCEMCRTTEANELTRFCIVNEQEEIVYNSLVKPDNDIIYYCSKFSGIRQGMLDKVDVKLADVQNFLINFLPSDSILIGHSLNFDLNALRLIHPYVIDTAVLYNEIGDHRRKPKLKTLAAEHLQMSIQNSDVGHCPLEDSLAAMRLVKKKLSQNITCSDILPKYPICEFNSTDESLMETKPEPNSSPSIIQNALKNDVEVTVIVSNDHTTDYEKYRLDDGSKGFELIISNAIRNRMVQARMSCQRRKLTAVSINKHTDESKKQFLERLSNLYTEIWNKNLAMNDALIIVLAAKAGKTNGVCLMNIKRSSL